jgi:phage baseplate assembly protein W
VAPTTLTWPLTPDPALPAVTPATSASSAAAASVARGLPAFLGRGILRPFTRDQKSDFAVGDGLALLNACIGQVLGTKGRSVHGTGELPWRGDFGSRLHLLRHRNNSAALHAFASVAVQEAIDAWEPRVRVTDVAVLDTANPRVLVVRVLYDLVDRSGRVVLRGGETSVPIETIA